MHPPEQLHLSNGIPVILQHYDGPAAATYWWVNTGSADEAPRQAGFAHFLEHMLFKDAAAKETGRSSTGQLARAVESLGGDINAYTSFDQTVYHVTCAAHHWERVIDAFGAMARPQKFLKKDFESEREVILEELRKNEDSPGRQIFQRLFSETFRKHPYGRPVIGFARTLKAARVTDLEGFYRSSYASGKMGLILVGPLGEANSPRRKALLRTLEKHYGSRVIRRALARRGFPRPAERELRAGPALSVRPFDVKTPTLSLSFRVPELLHPDTPALDLLAGILGAGELSRLYQRLFYKSAIATDASASLYVPRDPGMFYAHIEVDSVSKITAAAEQVFEELRRIAEEGPKPEELARVLVQAESERLYATQSADGMAGRIGFLKFIVGDLEFDRRYLDELRSVDGARIQEVARKYLDPRRMSAVALVPKADAKFSLDEVGVLATKVLPGAAAPVPATGPGRAARKKKPSVIAEPEIFRLPSGTQVVYYERPQSHVFSIQGAVLGGLRLELACPIESAEKDWGASYMSSLTWTKGTRSRSSNEIASLVEGSAASIDGFSGRNSVGVQMTGLARDWHALSGLFSDVLIDPVYPLEEVDHSRRVAQDAIRGIEDHTSQVCSKLFLECLFEHHPYGKLSYGSQESISAMTPEKLRAFHDAWVRPDRLTLSVSGSIRRSALDSWLSELDQALQARLRGKSSMVLPRAIEEEPALKAPRWVERAMGREQLHILVGGLGLRCYDEDRFALRVLQTLLGGQSGRLFIELREKRSLAYTVSPVSFEGLERGYVGTYIACAPQKKQEAIEGIHSVLESVAGRRPPTTGEMLRAKEFLLGRRAMDLQSDSAIASTFGIEALYGIPHLTDAELVRRIESVTARDVQKICLKYLVEPCMVTSAVG